MISAIIFDAFGTVVRIAEPRNPYRELLREGRRQGLSLRPDSLQLAMTMNLSLGDFASHLGIALSPCKHEELSSAMAEELGSIEPYPDALEALALLRAAGVKVGICSNLARPYGPAVRQLFPHMDGYAFSFEVGVMKPSPGLYLFVCEQMGVIAGDYFEESGRVLMIGDSQRCDRDGPRSVGIAGFYLDRSGRGQITDLAQFARLVVERNHS